MLAAHYACLVCLLLVPAVLGVWNVEPSIFTASADQISTHAESFPVATSGDLVAISDWFSVHVFNMSAPDIQASKVSFPRPDIRGFFAHSSIALSGTRLAAAQFGTHAISNPLNRVYLFDLTDSNPSLSYVAIRPFVGWWAEAFGYRVAFHGDVLIASAPWSGRYTPNPGYACGYNTSSPDFVYPHLPIWRVMASDGVEGDRFGMSLSVSGNWLAIGAPNHRPPPVVPTFTQTQGAVYIYDMRTIADQSGWTKGDEVKFVPREVSENNYAMRFGIHSAMFESTLAVTGHGGVYVYNVTSLPAGLETFLDTEVKISGSISGRYGLAVHGRYLASDFRTYWHSTGAVYLYDLLAPDIAASELRLTRHIPPLYGDKGYFGGGIAFACDGTLWISGMAAASPNPDTNHGYPLIWHSPPQRNLYRYTSDDILDVCKDQLHCVSLTLPLFAGQSMEVGEVTISNANNLFSLEFSLADGWSMGLVHLFIDTTAPAKSAPGRFPYHLQAGMQQGSFTWSVDATDLIAECAVSLLYLAVHAEVVTPQGGTETAWASCNNTFKQGWGSYCDSYIYTCGCDEGAADLEFPGDLDCCDCLPRDCPDVISHTLDLFSDDVPNEQVGRVQASVSLSQGTLSLHVSPPNFGHGRYYLDDLAVALSQENPEDWAGAVLLPWYNIVFSPVLVLDKADPAVYVVDVSFEELGLDLVDANDCNTTLYLSVEASMRQQYECTGDECESYITDKALYGRCIDPKACITFELNGDDTHAAVLHYCCMSESTEDDDMDENDCTRSTGYWKTHSSQPLQYAHTKSWPLPETSTLGSCPLSYLHILSAPPKGNHWLLLAKQVVATALNIAQGASPVAIEDSLAHARVLLETNAEDCEFTLVDAGRMDLLIQQLGSYNHGDIGPGHCSSSSSFCPQQCFCCFDCCPVASVDGEEGCVDQDAPQARSSDHWQRVTKHTATVCVGPGEMKTLRLKAMDGLVESIRSDMCDAEHVSLGVSHLEEEEGRDVTLLSFWRDAPGGGCCAASFDVLVPLPHSDTGVGEGEGEESSACQISKHYLYEQALF